MHFSFDITLLFIVFIPNRAVIAQSEYGLDDRGSIPGGCWEFFPKPPRPERLWGPPNLLSNGYQGFFPWR